MMTQQWTVWCENCSAMEQVSGSKKFVTAEVKSIGWTNKKKWLCPVCSSDALMSDRAKALAWWRTFSLDGRERLAKMVFPSKSFIEVDKSSSLIERVWLASIHCKQLNVL